MNAIVKLLITTLPLITGSVKTQKAFWRGLLSAALKASSLEAVSRTFKRCLSGRRLREIAQFIDYRKLRLSSHKALQHGLRKILNGLKADVAIDYTKTPYYGKPARNKKELIRRKADRGTANHHAYASIYVILRGRRFTLSAIPVRRKEPLVRIVLALIREATWSGLRVRTVLLDREFCTVPIQVALQKRHIAYVMAVKQQGKISGVKARVRKNKRKAVRVKHTWHDKTGALSVTADLYIVRRNARAGTGRTKTQYFTYAAWGIVMPPKRMKDFYRSRFGIESTYRMYDLVRGRTSSREPALRYLYVVVAFVVLNQWALTKYAACAKKQRGPRTVNEDKMRLKLYIDIVLRAMEQVLGVVRDVTVDCTLLEDWKTMTTCRRRRGG
jgi:putative transposase